MWCISIPMDLGVCDFCIKLKSKEKVIMHGHSTKEGFSHSFIGSNLLLLLLVSI